MLLQAIKRCYRIVRGAIATSVMISVAPTYIILHSGCKVVSIFLPRKFAHRYDDYLWGAYQRLVLFFFEHMTGVEIIISGIIPQEQENAILICNHQCSVDWVITDMIAVRQNMIGNLRYVFKDGIKYMPLYGYAFGVHGGVYVKRDGTYNDENMKKVVSKLQTRNAPTYFVVFPEGTRFSIMRRNTLAKSQAYAIANDLQPLNNVLTPRIKAFHCALNALQNYATAVYDATIVYEEKSSPVQPGNRCPAPSMWRFLLSPSPRIYIHVDRISVSDIPLNPQQSTLSWLHSRFKRKDAMISQHFEIADGQEETYTSATSNEATSLSGNGSVFRSGVLSKLPLNQTLPSAVFLTGITVVLLATRKGRLVYLSSLLGGSVFTVAYCKLVF